MSSSDREKLERLGERCITKVFKDALSFVELAGVDKEQFKRIRKQILRSGNDEIRKFKEEVAKKYDVSYKPSYDERIDFDN